MMFVYTWQDVVLLLLVTALAAVWLFRWIRSVFCKHSDFREDWRTLRSTCGKCGKDVGFRHPSLDKE